MKTGIIGLPQVGKTSLFVWVGGLIFFAFVLAPTVFHEGILPARQFAGNVVNRSLAIMHWMGLICGIVFAATSMIDARVADGAAHPFALRNLLIYAMILLTLVAMFGIASRMAVLHQDTASAGPTRPFPFCLSKFDPSQPDT